MRLLRNAFLLVAVALAVMVPLLPAPAGAAQAHEDPDAAPWVFDGVSVLEKYSEALDTVLPVDLEALALLQEQALLANIPDDLRKSADIFLSSAQPLAELIPAIRANLETARTLLAQARPEQAREASVVAGGEIIQAYTRLRAMETTAQDAGRWWKVDSAHPQGPLRRAYDEVMDKLRRLRDLVGLLDEMNSSVALRADKGSPITVSPTTLTLSASPGSAFVGEEVEFRGTLAGGGSPLSGRTVTLLLNGSASQVLETDEVGSFGGRLTLPYVYEPEATIQAVFYPEGDDQVLFLGCASPEVDITVLFYSATLGVEVPDRGYPGLDLAVNVDISYGDNPPPAGRTVLVYWDEDLVYEVTASGGFEREIAVPENMASGEHRVSVYALPQGRYAPADSSAQVQVARAAVIVDVHAQSVLLLPMSLGVSGRAHSTLGPLRNALLTVRLGDWQTTTRSDGDGRFDMHLGTGVSLTLFGAQQLSVAASPEEPWHESGSTVLNTTVINSVNIAGLLLALVALAAFALRWMRGRPARIAALPRAQAYPAAMVTMSPPQKTLPAAQETATGPGAVLLAVYREALRLVQGVTSIALGPSRTLREYAQECGPRLGPLAGYFRDLTMMVERLLYSRHEVVSSEAERSAELGRTLKEGLEREST